MATVLAFCRAFRPAALRHAACPTISLRHTRTIHSTPIVLKKKQASASSDVDDLFDDSNDNSDSLFPSSSVDLFSEKSSLNPRAIQDQNVSANALDIPPHHPSVPASSKYERKARFEELYQFARACLVAKTEPARQVRSSIWIHLFNLADSFEQLTRAIDMLPAWRGAKRTFTPAIAEALARRCAQLHCSELALQVFGSHPTYGLDLTLPAARCTLRALALSENRTISDCITFTTLFSIYKLPSVSSDLFCTTALLAACLKKDSEKEKDPKYAHAIARAMLPSLMSLLKKTSQDLAVSNQVEIASVHNILSRIQTSLHELEKQNTLGWLDDWLSRYARTAA